MSKNILVIVEGAKTEYNFFTSMFSSFGIDYHIVCFRTNIYTLYKKMKDYSFNCNIKDILKEQLGNSIDTKELLKNFLYTYLVFDCDAHHCDYQDKNLSIDIKVNRNIKKLKEMVAYFTNETDPSIGKLYINYPMIESFRDSDSFFENEYSNRTVKLKDLGIYKQIVSNKKLANKHLNDYCKENFIDLCRMNIFKLRYINRNIWGWLPYNDYITMSEGKRILSIEHKKITTDSTMFVLNSSLFIIVDYFGNKNKFYENNFGAF